MEVNIGSGPEVPPQFVVIDYFANHLHKSPPSRSARVIWGVLFQADIYQRTNTD
jgi:hypothetical protein